jgi:hypothetical protein
MPPSHNAPQKPLIVVNFAYNGDVANIFCSVPADVLLLYEEGQDSEHQYREAMVLEEGGGHAELMEVPEWDTARKLLPAAQQERYGPSEEEESPDDPIECAECTEEGLRGEMESSPCGSLHKECVSAHTRHCAICRKVFS